MNKKTIKWGIIGLGKIANKFATDLKVVNDSELYAVASRSKEKSDAFAKEYSANKAYNSYEDLAKDNQVDAIYIATPHPFHAVHAIMCLKHKKPVLCEKPLAMNLQEVEEMIAVAKENNVLLMEALWTGFLPSFQYVLELVQNKKLGNITHLEADFGFKPVYNADSRLMNKALGAGSLLDIGIYPIFLALSTLGIPNSIEANATFLDTGADEECNMVFNYNDVKANLKSTIKEKTPTEATIIFDKGTVKLNSRFFEQTSVTITENDTENTIEFPTKAGGFDFEIEHFNQLIRDAKTESNIMTFEFSKTLISTLDKVRTIIDLEY